jgi:hypothetical protein
MFTRGVVVAMANLAMEMNAIALLLQKLPLSAKRGTRKARARKAGNHVLMLGSRQWHADLAMQRL